MDREVDLAIVGAGPAGASSALHLAQLAPSLARRRARCDTSSSGSAVP